MKTALLVFSALILSVSTLAQGTLIFNNRTPTGDAPVILPDGSGAGNLPGVVAQLFRVSGGGVMIPLTPTTTFRTTSPAATYFVTEISPFVVDGVLPGQSVTVRMRVYQGSSYDTAVASGLPHWESNDVVISQLGGTLENGQMLPTPSLNGLSFGGTLTPTLRFDFFGIEGDNLRFGLSVNMPQPSYVLEASQDAVTWQSILTNAPTSVTIPYNPTINPNRFFRLRTIPLVTSTWGTLNFNNRTATGDAPVSLPNGTGAGNLPGVVAQLYLVGAGGMLTPLTPTTTFRTSSAAATFFINAINPFPVEGVRPGQRVTVRMRVYQGSSYEDAQANGLFWGQSNDVTIPQLGGTLEDGTIIPTPDLSGLQWLTPI
jgi:hypothetical protein